MSESADFFGDAKKELEAYIENRILLAKMQATHQLSQKMAIVVVFTLILTLLGFALVFGGITTAYYLTDLTGSLVKGFGYVAAFFGVTLCVLLLFRKKLITQVVNLIIKLLFK